MAPGHVVLLVDDEPDILESLAELVEARIDGVQVHTAADADEALAWLADHKADVIVSDFRMPGLNGLEFLVEAKKRHGDQLAILLTAFDERRSAVEAARAGVIRRFFMKPPDAFEVIAGIEELLDPGKLQAE